MPATTAETLSLVSRNVSVAPLVLLSAADHFGRSGKGLRKRVVGVLLGQNDGKNVRVSNSFAGEYNVQEAAMMASSILTTTDYSTLRRRRKGSVSMVSRPQLCRRHERYVQEGQRPREADRMVSLGAKTTSLGSGDQ